MARNVASARSVASARIALVYPRNPMGAVYIPGAKSIEGATGDVARTTNGWIENEKFHWYASQTATAWSAEFDTAVTRTGTKTLKVSTTDITGRISIIPSDTETWPQKARYMPIIKPSTAYILNCWVKTTNVTASGVYLRSIQFDVDGGLGTIALSSTLSGTNDWTLLTVSFTSDADAKYFWIEFRNFLAGNVSDSYFDVNSMTLIESNIVRNPVV